MNEINGHQDFGEWPEHKPNDLAMARMIDRVTAGKSLRDKPIEQETSIASTEVWEDFAEKVKWHVMDSQKDKYAKDNQIQTVDYIGRNVGSIWMIGNALKYACRYIKTHDKLDILKAAHYLAMAWVLDK